MAQNISDDDREQILRLVLLEAKGTDVGERLNAYPQEARNMFRKVVLQGGLVQAPGLQTDNSAETRFKGKPRLTPRGAKRLKELNERLGE